MNQKNKNWIKFKNLFKIAINNISNTQPISLKEKQITELAIKAINNEKSLLLILPQKDNMRWVYSEKNGKVVTVTIKYGIVEAVNGSFSYTMNAPEKCLKEIITAFNDRLERDADNWDKLIAEKNNINLTAILNRI